MKKRKFSKQDKLSIIKEPSKQGFSITLEKHGIFPTTYYSWKSGAYSVRKDDKYVYKTGINLTAFSQSQKSAEDIKGIGNKQIDV